MEGAEAVVLEVSIQHSANGIYLFECDTPSSTFSRASPSVYMFEWLCEYWKELILTPTCTQSSIFKSLPFTPISRITRYHPFLRGGGLCWFLFDHLLAFSDLLNQLLMICLFCCVCGVCVVFFTSKMCYCFLITYLVCSLGFMLFLKKNSFTAALVGYIEKAIINASV